MNTQYYLPLQPLLVVVEEAEAVEFVLWRGAAGVTAPAARLVFRFRPRRRRLIRAASAVSSMSRFGLRRWSLNKQTRAFLRFLGQLTHFHPGL